MAEREIWKPVPGFEGYEVSDLGRVRSVDRVLWKQNRWGKPGWRRYRGKVLSPGYDGRYLGIHMGTYRQIRVHQLVMLAFVGEPPPGMEVAHKDGIGTNCKLANLRYDTPPGNAADKLVHGTDARGEKCPTARLTREAVRAIRRSTLDRKLLAEAYGVSKSHIDNIKAGHRWGWLDADDGQDA